MTKYVAGDDDMVCGGGDGPAGVREGAHTAGGGALASIAGAI